MFDVDKYLDEIKIKEVTPKVAQIDNVKSVVLKHAKPEKKAKPMTGFKKAMLIGAPAMAVIIVGIILGAMFMGGNIFPAKAVACYTIDINPSISLNVDDENIVTSVDNLNNDAQDLMAELDVIGLPVEDALEQIILLALDKGYLSNDENFVLLGQFLEGPENAQLMESLQSRLEAQLNDNIKLVLISGNMDDKDKADSLNVSAGLLKLSYMADDLKLTGDEKVQDVLQEVEKTQTGNLAAPTMTLTAKETQLEFTWGEMDFAAMGYEGSVKYRIVYAKTEGELSPDNNVLFSKSFDSTADQPTMHMEKLGETLMYSEQYFFKFYAIYGDTVIKGNKLMQKTVSMATEKPEPTTKPTAEPTEKPVELLLEGYVSGEYVVLNWDKAEGDDFSGYKVVASQDNENPSYPDDGYLKYITDVDKTKVSLYDGYQGLVAGKTYYFAITYLYGDEKVTTNSVMLKVPQRVEKTPKPTEPAEEYQSSNIEGSIDGNTITLNWQMIDQEGFEGYKVMYSFTDSSPVYGDGSKYAKWITDPSTTSCTLDAPSLTGYQPGIKGYFSITALYNDHSVKKPGNTVKLLMPEEAAASEMPSTNIEGSLNGDIVSLYWGKIDHPNFDGYKVMYSFTDSTPVYGESGCNYAKWITNPDTTGCQLDVTTLSGYTAGATCYFSITALYNDHGVKRPGNTISKVMPDTEPVEYVASNISGSDIVENILSLYWESVDHPQFAGYKVMYSFTNSSPVYGADGCTYYTYITNASTTGVSMNVTELNGYQAGATCYFSITVLYDGGEKRAGNTISRVMPE